MLSGKVKYPVAYSPSCSISLPFNNPFYYILNLKMARQAIIDIKIGGSPVSPIFTAYPHAAFERAP
jgi:hypothetical protein